MDPASPVHRTLLRYLPDVELRYGGRSPLVSLEVDTDATLDWWVDGVLTIAPDLDTDDDEDLSWVGAKESSLHASRTGSDGPVELTIYQASGVTVDLSRVNDLADTLDARSSDAAHFMPLVQAGSGELIGEVSDEFFALGSTLVVVDRVQLAAAWRRAGGVGALLTACALRWLTADAQAVAVHPFPFELGEHPTEAPGFAEALAGVRRTWASLGFSPTRINQDVWVIPARGRPVLLHDDGRLRRARARHEPGADPRRPGRRQGAGPGRRPPSVMDADKLAAARARAARGESPTDIARPLGVSRATVYRHLAATEASAG